MSDRLFVDPELWFCKNPKLAFPGIQIGNDVFSGTKVYWGNGNVTDWISSPMYDKSSPWFNQELFDELMTRLQSEQK